MAMTRDLFLAILAMDSYNRGYGEGITGLDSPGPNPDDAVDIRIGRAKIVRDANDASGLAQAAGFYAIAYDVSGVKATDGAGFTHGERVMA